MVWTYTGATYIILVPLGHLVKVFYGVLVWWACGVHIMQGVTVTDLMEYRFSMV